MMEAVAEEQGHIEADKEIGFEDDTVGAIQDEEFDFDIGGPGDNLEEALGEPESTGAGLAYHSGNNDTLHDARTHSIRDQMAQDTVDESHQDGTSGHGEDQHDSEVPALDTSVDAEGVEQAYHFGDARGDQTERQISQQAGDAQYAQGNEYQEDVYLEDTAEELGSFVDAGQQNEELAQSMTVAAGSVEFSHLEDEQFEDDIHDEGISAEQIGVIQSGDEMQPPVDTNYVDEITENETTVVQTHNEEAALNASPEPDSYPVDIAADQTTTGASYDSDDARGQEAESSKRSEQHPRVRVSYGTAEFYLFAESPDADPDDYFFESTDVLEQPLSQFLPKLRQVITEDLQASDELFVKVDGLGLEFGEATTKDFLEHTTFGQVLELYERLVKLDDDSSEAPELYIYLETRPSCLHRLTELNNNANEGKGLSQIAFYYEGTPDFAAIEDESNDYDQGHQGIDSNGVSDNGSNDGIEGEPSVTHETEQAHNPFRLSGSQQQALETSNSVLEEEEVANESLSAGGDEGHAAYEDDNGESFSDEVQDGLGLAATEASHDVSAPEAQQDSDMVPGEDEDLATAAANDEPEDQHYVEEDLPGRGEDVGTEADAEAENKNFPEDDGPTDDYDTAENDDYLDIGATEEEPAEPADYAASAGTPEPPSHDSSATATLDGDGHGHGDDVPATQALTDADDLVQAASQLEPGPPETETDEIHWNDDDENDYDDDEVDFANQNQTDLSPSSPSVKRGREADEDDVGLGDDSIAKRRRT